MLFWAILLLALPFVLPIVSLVRSSRTRADLRMLERTVANQEELITKLAQQLGELRRTARPEPPPAPVVPTPAPRRVSTPAPPVVPTPAPPVVPAPVPPVIPAAATQAAEIPAPPPPPEKRRPERVVEPVAAPRSGSGGGAPPEWPPFTVPSFDWESLIGVKLFSAIAGIALVIAAVFFLRYSVERGWLEPPVRVVIGVLVALALLASCELKGARRYPATANALDAAGIAILFATFFAAHALWHLIPAGITFALLALVTAVAVALSLRRDSLFIAVLGLLGGFATPALLSTGENRPIPLFAYLLLLNIGLAWVAYRKRWAALSALTVVLTAIYQWGWTFRFLSASQLSLAAAIFLQVVGLAVQVKQQSDNQSSRLIHVWAITAVTPLEKGIVRLQSGATPADMNTANAKGTTRYGRLG